LAEVTNVSNKDDEK